MSFFQYFDDHVKHITQFLGDRDVINLLQTRKSFIPQKKIDAKSFYSTFTQNGLLNIVNIKTGSLIPNITNNIKVLWISFNNSTQLLPILYKVGNYVSTIIIAESRITDLDIIETLYRDGALQPFNKSIQLDITRLQYTNTNYKKIIQIFSIIYRDVTIVCTRCNQINDHVQSQCNACALCKQDHAKVGCPLCKQFHTYECAIPYINFDWHHKPHPWVIQDCPDNPIKRCFICNSRFHDTRHHPCDYCGEKHGNGKRKCKHPMFCAICKTIDSGHTTLTHPCFICNTNPITGVDSKFCQECMPCLTCGVYKAEHGQSCTCPCRDPACDISKTQILLRNKHGKPCLLPMTKVNWANFVDRNNMEWNCINRTDIKKCDFCCSPWHSSRQHRHNQKNPVSLYSNCVLCKKICTLEKPIFNKHLCKSCKICSICFQLGHMANEHACPCGQKHDYMIVVKLNGSKVFKVPHTVYFDQSNTKQRKMLNTKFDIEIPGGGSMVYISYVCPKS